MADFERPVFFDKESANEWSNYYTKKSKIGSGIAGYHGDLYQRGSGIFGDILRASLPIIKYLGKKTAGTFIKASSDALSGDNFVESLKRHGKQTAKDIVGEVAEKATSKLT